MTDCGFAFLGGTMSIIMDGLVVVICAGVVATLLAMLVHGRLSEHVVNEFRHHSVLIVGVPGTLFAIVVGMLAVNVSSDISSAGDTAAAEASAIESLAWYAHSTPPDEDGRLTALLQSYTTQVIRDDWPLMASRQQLSQQTGDTLDAVQYALGSYQPANLGEMVRYQTAQDDLRDIYRDRLDRQQEAGSGVPGILWLALIVSGSVVLVTPILSGSHSRGAHALLSFSTAGVMAFVLFMIAMFNHPFSGTISISSREFGAARQYIQQIDAHWTAARAVQPRSGTGTVPRPHPAASLVSTPRPGHA